MPKNRLLLAVLIVLGVVVVVIIAVPFFVNADSFRPTIESQLQSSLGRQVTIGGLSLSLLAGGVTAKDITISDDPAFNKEPFLKAKSLAVGVKLLPLIFSRSVEVTSITIDHPELTLVHSASGQWNFSSLGGAKKASPSSSNGNFSVGKLKITNGQVTIEKAGGKASVYQDVKLTASNISYDSPIPFTLEAKTPGGGKLKVEGSAGPINQADSALTPLQAQVTIDNMDLASTGFLDPSSGIQGVVDYKGTVKSDGKSALAEGQATVDKLRVVPAGAPAKQAVSLSYASTYDLKREAGVLTRGDIRTGSSTVRLSGDYDMHGPATLVHMKLNGSQLPVRDVEGLLPAVGVTLPAGASLQSGTLTMNLALDGPVDRLVTTGTAQLADARLTGYDLASKMKGLSALSFLQSTSSDTVIQTLSSNLRIAPDGIRADNLNVVIPALGSLTGNGTIGNNNALNFHMVARLAQNSMVSQMAKNIPILGGAGGGGIPFMIQGTTSQPVFLPDVAGAVKGAVANPLQQQQQQNPLGNMLQGILGGKKK
ncbi:MAG: AsmA family protein [Terriglobales bacterium]